MKVNKVLTWMIMSFVALTAAFAATTVTDFEIQKDNGDYMLLVSLDNTANATVYEEVSFSIIGEGTTNNVGTVKLTALDAMTLTYNLRDSVEPFSDLKIGETYTVKVTVENEVTNVISSQTEAFLFGTEAGSDELDLILEEISVNNIESKDVDTLQVLNGETLNFNLRFVAAANVEDARILIMIDGYEHTNLLTSTDIFDAKEGKTYVKSLSLTLPSDMTSERDYVVRIIGANGVSGISYKELNLFVDTQRERVDVLDLVMTPSNGVEAGQNLIANVRLKNMGQKDQDSVKVTISIPELKMSESSYVSNLNERSIMTSDDMLLFVPETAAAGSYEAKVTLTYNDGYTETSKAYSLNVLATRTVAEDNLLVSFKNNVDLSAGSTVEVVVANPNSKSMPISLVPVENAWSTVEVSPTLAMVQGGASTTFVVTVTPKAGALGEKDIALVVKEGSNTVNEFVINGFVSESESSIDWLNVGLVILLIIAIVVLLSLVMSIAKRRNDKDDEELSSNEEYY
jgi:hypothetical protein